MQNKAYLIHTFLTLFKMHSMSCVDVDVVDGKIDGIGGSFIIECEPNCTAAYAHSFSADECCTT